MQSDYNWMVPVEVMLGSLDHGEVQACSISRVPDELRDPKEDAYMPKLFSIGPLHRGATRHLLLMEEPKWRYMKDFLDRKATQEETAWSEVRLRNCGIDILKLDKEELLPMFRTLSKGAEHVDSSYTQVCASLNAHRAKKVTRAFHEFPIITWHGCRFVLEIIAFYWRNWYKVLIREHIPTVWKLIGVLAAILLLVLTIMQTYYAATPRYG